MALLDSLLSLDLVNAAFFNSAWGIFTSEGSPVIVADNVLSFEFKKDWNVSDYPLEKGAFESYNKVQLPYEARIMFSTGGSLAARRAFLQSIQAIAGNLKLYSVVTPEFTYPKANITHYDYARNDGKAGLLKVEVGVREIRNDAKAAFGFSDDGTASANGGADATAAGSTGAPAIDATSSPSSASSVSTGEVQAFDPTDPVYNSSIPLPPAPLDVGPL